MPIRPNGISWALTPVANRRGRCTARPRIRVGQRPTQTTTCPARAINAVYVYQIH